jgi:hypothetical protein
LFGVHCPLHGKHVPANPVFHDDESCVCVVRQLHSWRIVRIHHVYFFDQPCMLSVFSSLRRG